MIHKGLSISVSISGQETQKWYIQGAKIKSLPIKNTKYRKPPLQEIDKFFLRKIKLRSLSLINQSYKNPKVKEKECLLVTTQESTNSLTKVKNQIQNALIH